MANAELAPYMLGTQFLTGVFQGLDAASSYRHQLRIGKIQRDLNEHFAEKTFHSNMEQLYTAQNEVKAQATQELMEEQKAFRERQAQVRVFQAETGQEGQSSIDTHNQLLASHHAWRQVQLSNIQKAERQLELQKLGATNARIAQKASNSVKTFAPSATLAALSGGAQGFVQGLGSYYKFMNWADEHLNVSVDGQEYTQSDVYKEGKYSF